MCLYGYRGHIYSTFNIEEKEKIPGKVYNLIKKKGGSARLLVSQRRNHYD